MTNGLKIDYGNKIGKTIIFAQNHKHAEKILKCLKRISSFEGICKSN